MRDKKIAIFHNLPTGGGKRSLYEWITRLVDGNEVTLFTYAENDGYLNIDRLVHKVIRVGDPKNKIDLILKNYKIAKIIDRNNYDFVFVNHDKYFQSPLMMLFCETTKIYYCQEPSRRDEFPSTGISGTLKDRLLMFIDKVVARKANLILCNSGYSKNRIKDRYNVEATISPLGVGNKFLKNTLECDNIDCLNILSAGRLHRSKGHEFIIDVLSKLSVPYKFDIINDDEGNSQYKNYLLNYAEKKSVRVNICSIAENELENFYKKHNVFCAGQYNEPFGLVILEAMASELVVVAVNEGGFNDIIKNGIDGFLVSRSVENFLKVLESIYIDKDAAKKIRVEARRSAKEWTWEKSYEKLITFI